MADDAVALAIRMEARFDKLERDLKRAGVLADQAVKDIEDKFSKLNPSLPSNFLTGIFQGIGQRLAQELDPKKIVEKLKETLFALAAVGETAKKVAVDVEDLQKIRFGVGTQSGLETKEILKDTEDFAKNLRDAKTEENDLSKLFAANNIKLKDRNGEAIKLQDAMARVADLVKNAKDEFDKVKIVELVGLSKGWVGALEAGGDAFNKVANGAQAAGKIIDRDIIETAEKFKKRWNEAVDNMTTNSLARFGQIANLIDELIQKAGPLFDVLSSAGTKLATAVSDAFTASHIKAKADLAGVDTGKFVKSLSIEELEFVLPKAREQNKELAAIMEQRLQILRASKAAEDEFGGIGDEFIKRGFTLPPKPPAKPTILPKEDEKETKDAFDKATDSINKRTAALLADKAAIGLTAGAQEQFRAELRLLEAAQRDDSDITDAMINKYAELRSTMSAANALTAAGIELEEEKAKKFAASTERIGAASAALAQYKKQFEGANEALKFGGNELVNVLDAATQKGFVFGTAIQQVLRNVTRALLQAAITGEGAFAKILGLSSGVPGGVGGILGLLGGLGTAAKGAALANTASPAFGDFVGPRMLAGGGHVRPGEWAIAGENGPEPIFGGRTGATVLPNKAMGGGMVFSPTTVIDARGSTISEAQIEAIVARGNAGLAREIDRNFIGRQQKLANLGT